MNRFFSFCESLLNHMSSSSDMVVSPALSLPFPEPIWIFGCTGQRTLHPVRRTLVVLS